ncbi:hypothetical protein BCF55_0882 [Hydrogenivirga caldilitoris]|uniref:Uncharacterized protein n=1 Tax=Hydrogenivirga caldilitoris TaxID=246264 RepID=A0A497XNT5_9AQUI|nr:hypothetical protein [Hydrogenivirga caldilitoris]RLJ70605.1 hypothetical protein BCF55_0882 [Hydrogenivirga caldilitoris]
MWREALLFWKISVLKIPTLVAAFLLILFSVFTFMPPFSLPALLFNYYLTFSYVVFMSKKYIETEGNPSTFEEATNSPIKFLYSYASETIGVLVAQFLLTLGAILFALIVFSVGGVWSVIKPLFMGGDVSWTGLVLSLVLSLFVYFSVVTSFPIFFGRAMLRGKGFSQTLSYFLTSLYAEISWKTILNWDYIKSSAIVSLITLCLLVLNLLIAFITPLALLAPAVTLLNLYLLYLFGTVASFRLLRF